MRTILERDPAAAVEAPLKIVVREDGAVTELRTADPAVAFAAHPTLADLGATLHDVAVALLAPPA
jgi:hypothetical protein